MLTLCPASLEHQTCAVRVKLLPPPPPGDESFTLLRMFGFKIDQHAFSVGGTQEKPRKSYIHVYIYREREKDREREIDR